VKDLIHEGNVRRVVVQHEGRTVAEFPLTAGVVGAVLHVEAIHPDAASCPVSRGLPTVVLLWTIALAPLHNQIGESVAALAKAPIS
jgi:hypothetical protein